jgi:hypothetical protein
VNTYRQAKCVGTPVLKAPAASRWHVLRRFRWLVRKATRAGVGRERGVVERLACARYRTSARRLTRSLSELSPKSMSRPPKRVMS